MNAQELIYLVNANSQVTTIAVEYVRGIHGVEFNNYTFV